ncbi:hypothetical protein PybrP1_000891 [[Pythium] brassicae (nom. inval.)]|nr:hypothetical protein PybrP1_000891 [[Pythium] brassicae (nom. inval.)]
MEPSSPPQGDAAVLLRVADVFDPRAAEAAIQRLVDVVNRQALETQELREHVRRLESQQRDHAAWIATALHEHFGAADERLASLEAQATRRQRREHSSDLRVARLEAAARDAASQRCAIREHVVQVERAGDSALEKLRTETASFALVNRLHADQQVVQDRLATLDRRLDAKMEKTEATRIEALVGKINTFAPQSEQLREELATLAASHKQLAELAAASNEHWESCKQRLSGYDEQVALAALKLSRLERLVNSGVVKRLGEQGEKLQHAEDAIRGFAVRASSSDAAQRALSAKFHSVASVLAEQLLVNERASATDVVQQIAGVRSDLSARAYADELQALAEVVEELTVQCSSLEKHVELSSRFMGWFASRGEAFEHNLDVVEAQLGRLAFNSRPEHRDPFAGQVRYPHR